ncbi:hypothetical protein HIM_06907 [Hirsutella minnesotensis 3608]|uniref:GED domain-containing protein n=1 Tax=Hirsutella minnesotensis 3608 TaxID=1043627 RepID=A0A0F8A4L5_9HYPO|nr:hypothetical protein HIM_06907 [Hirsutella minnesotensis 3608]
MAPSSRRRHDVRDVKEEPQVANSPEIRQPLNGILESSSAYEDNSARSLQPMSSARFGRSDAPTPSEPDTEPGPLLRELRSREAPSFTAPVASPTNAHESFLQTSFQDIGKGLKECMDTLGELQQLGISYDVKLPELVLVGDQSAGKSSLMSGLANLELPRSEGTCTRCPLHIRVSRHSHWSCRVSLRKDYKYDPPAGQDIQNSNVGDADPFYPWKKLPATKVTEFKVMHDKSEIEEVLRWAQIAILNDNHLPGQYIPGTGRTAIEVPLQRAAETTEAKFSPNIVALEIKSPDLPDLSFYDMPGIFENPADARDDYLVSVVRNLTKSYIAHDTAIVICCMPMNSDAENSSTLGLVRRLGAQSRTIGVLTKADLLPEGNHDQWLAIMKGQAHKTGHGYFVTSRPQGKELEDLKEWEKRIFEDNSCANWPSSFHAFVERCGIERLKDFLAERLSEAFIKSLPQVKQNIQRRLNDNLKELRKLPELPDNVQLEIQTGLIAFADSSRSKMDEFMGRFNQLPRSFRECLLEIKPKFTLKDRSDIPVLEISDDDSDAASVATQPTPTPKRIAPPSLATPSKRQRVNGHITNGNGHVKAEEPVFTPPARPQARTNLMPPFDKFAGTGRGFRTLRQVREEMNEKTKAGMPDRISDEVYTDLVKEALRPWRGPTDAFLVQTMHDLGAVLLETLDRALVNMKKRFIYKEARRHVKAFLDQHLRETRVALMDLCGDEQGRLMTFNDEAFARYRDDEYIVLTRFRHVMRMEAAGFQSSALGQWSDMTEESRAKDIKLRETELLKLGPDQFVRELEVVAYVRGYYRLAALRFADAVSQRILCRMIPAIRLQMPTYLEEQLGLRTSNAHHIYERLMSEDGATASKRENVKLERDKFIKALERIEKLEMGVALAEDLDEQSTQAQSFTHMDTDMGMDADDGEA